MSQAAADGSMYALDVVLFHIGAWRMGVEAQQIRALRPSVGQQQCPRLTDLLHLPNSLGAAPQQLQVRCAALDYWIEVDGPIDIICVPARNIYRLPALLAARTQWPGLRALLLHQQQGAIALLDLAGLMPAPAL